MYKVVYLPSARNDLEEAAVYIAVNLNAPDAATGLIDAVDKAARNLEYMPYRYAVYPLVYPIRREVRFVPVKNYNLFYCVDEESKIVEIQRILYRRRNMRNTMS